MRAHTRDKIARSNMISIRRLRVFYESGKSFFFNDSFKTYVNGFVDKKYILGPIFRKRPFKKPSDFPPSGMMSAKKHQLNSYLKMSAEIR